MSNLFHCWAQLFHQIDPSGALALHTLAEVQNLAAWGGETQIKVAAHLLKCTIRVHMLNGWTADYGTEGPIHHILYHNREYPQGIPNHYDFLLESTLHHLADAVVAPTMSTEGEEPAGEPSSLADFRVEAAVPRKSEASQHSASEAQAWVHTCDYRQRWRIKRCL